MTAAETANSRSPARRRFTQAWLLAITCAALSINTATPAYAQDDDEELPDARLTGYEQPVAVGGGTMFTYLTAAFLGVISVGITFKNARRTHLD